MSSTLAPFIRAWPAARRSWDASSRTTATTPRPTNAAGAVAIREVSGADATKSAPALEDYPSVLRKAGRNSDAEKAEARAKSLRIPTRPAAPEKP